MTKKRKNMGDPEASPETEPGSYAEESFEETDGEYEGEAEFDFSDELDDEEYDTPFFKPMQSRKAWAILALILVVIAVSVLYVYQTGDKKTVLGNQPIPAGQSNLVARAAAVNVPVVGGAVNIPIGGGMMNVPGAGARGNQPSVPSTVNTVQCPHCSTGGLPVCSGCGAVMQPLTPGSDIYVCPSCGKVGVPICPRCGTHMTGPGSGLTGPSAKPIANANVGGQFQCPACRSTGLPNWDQAGIAHCPNCGTPMKVRSKGNTVLAAAP